MSPFLSVLENTDLNPKVYIFLFLILWAFLAKENYLIA
jgi:hypothetical protein